MKKTLFAALALVSMASCSNEEVLDVAQKEAIGFENAFVNNSTRSVIDPSKTKDAFYEAFNVYAFVNGATLLDNAPVSNTSGTWSYGEPQYWINGATYNFTAYAPKSNDLVVTANTTTTKDELALTFTNNNGKVDVLYAKPSTMTGKQSGNGNMTPANGTVGFDFNHILSKVKFSFTNEYNVDAASIKVYDIAINNSPKQGNVVLNGTTTWTAVEGSGNATLSFGKATDDEGTNDKESVEVAYGFNKTYESENELLLIPVEGSYEVTFKVDLLISNTKIATYNHKANVTLDLTPGYSYDIVAKINATNIDPDDEDGQETIQFTVNSVAGWTQGTASEITTTVPNTTTQQ